VRVKAIVDGTANRGRVVELRGSFFPQTLIRIRSESGIKLRGGSWEERAGRLHRRS